MGRTIELQENDRPDEETPVSHLWPSVLDDWDFVKGSSVYKVNPRYRAEGVMDYIEMDALDTTLPTPNYVGRRNQSEYSGQMFAPRDTLFARITPCTENGKAALVPDLRSEVGIGSTEFIVLSPKADRILPQYLYYLTKSHPIHNYAISRMRGSTGRQRVPASVFRNEIRFPLPPLPEQRKIASVLYTVDQAIQTTEAVIERAKRVKRGLMQDLLTGGIDSDSEIRSPDDMPHRFDDTALGKVPKSWRMSPLSEICSEIVDSPHSTPSYAEEGIPIVRTSDVRDGRFKPDGVKRVTEEDYQDRISRLEPKPGDIIFTREAPVGEAFKIPSGTKLCLGQRTMVLRPSQGVLDPDFLVHSLYSHRIQKRFNQLVVGTTNPHLNVGTIRNFKLPLPSLDEQRRIVSVLNSVDNEIDSASHNRDALKQLKKGLMQDLLTGKVRTADKDIAILDEVAAHG